MQILADRHNLRAGGITLCLWLCHFFYFFRWISSKKEVYWCVRAENVVGKGRFRGTSVIYGNHVNSAWTQHVNKLLGEKLSASDVNVVEQAAEHNVAHILTLAPNFTCHANIGIGHLVLTSWIGELNKIVMTTSEPKHKTRPTSLGCRLLKI